MAETIAQSDDGDAERFAESAARFARMGADGQKARVAGSVRAFAAALRTGTRELPQEHDEFRPLLNNVADRADRVSSYIAGRDLDSLVHDVRRLARRHPSLLIGGVFALGFIGMRVLLDSAYRAPLTARHIADRAGSNSFARVVAEEYDAYATAAHGNPHG